jgi:hypothetical protein
MKATNKLRFVERLEPITETTGRRVRILQQWWEGLGPNATINYAHPDAHKLRNNPPGEWRDVPVEVEA